MTDQIGYYIDVREFRGDSLDGYPKYAGDDTQTAKAMFEQEFDAYDSRLRKADLVIELCYRSEKGEVPQMTKLLRDR